MPKKNLLETEDQNWLKLALELAELAAERNEVPVGAVVVLNNELIGQGYNQPIKTNDPTAHAEIIALREAATRIGNYRLVGSTLYTTLEPCAMCTGALLHARVKRLVFGAADPKGGFVQNNGQLLKIKHSHRIRWEGGLLSDECLEILQTFFKARRRLGSVDKSLT